MFSRLCEMHLETESDGDQDFLAAFANYNPGEHKCCLCCMVAGQKLEYAEKVKCLLSVSSESETHMLHRFITLRQLTQFEYYRGQLLVLRGAMSSAGVSPLDFIWV